MTLNTWLAFLAAAWAISLSPGAGAVAAMSSGLRHGLARGYWTTVGLQFGFLLHLAIVAAGLGALLAASSIGFEVLKWIGVGYLCWLGLRQWLSAAAAPKMDSRGGKSETRRQMVARGFLVNASNPKAIVFMLAVLPQFVDAGRPLLPQYLVIAATMVVVDLIVMGAYTGLAAKLLRVLREPRHMVFVNRLFGALFIGAAMLLAAFRRPAI